MAQPHQLKSLGHSAAVVGMQAPEKAREAMTPDGHKLVDAQAAAAGAVGKHDGHAAGPLGGIKSRDRASVEQYIAAQSRL